MADQNVEIAIIGAGTAGSFHIEFDREMQKPASAAARSAAYCAQEPALK